MNKHIVSRYSTFNWLNKYILDFTFFFFCLRCLCCPVECKTVIIFTVYGSDIKSTMWRSNNGTITNITISEDIYSELQIGGLHTYFSFHV